jgi:hypothetical protein
MRRILLLPALCMLFAAAAFGQGNSGKSNGNSSNTGKITEIDDDLNNRSTQAKAGFSR